MTKLLQPPHTQKRAPPNKHKRILATLLHTLRRTKKGDKFVRNRVAVFIWEINLIILLNVAWSIWRDLQANHFFILLRDESADSAASAFAARCLRLCRCCCGWPQKVAFLYLQHQHYPLGCSLDYSFAALNLFTQNLSLISAANSSIPLTQQTPNMQNCLSSDHQVSRSTHKTRFSQFQMAVWPGNFWYAL